MNKSISLIFAYRNRDSDRIINAMRSLEKQTDPDFEVIFVDYGSIEGFAQKVHKALSQFSFVRYFYVAHPGLLWNKSKAFNYGIKKSDSEYIITADIDLIFHHEFIVSARKLASPKTYTVFSYAYLQEKESPSANSDIQYSELKPSHTGYITGSGLYPKAALKKVHGFDEFYHFYGSEDEDLFLRLEHLGLKKIDEEKNMLAHQWHPRYPFEEKDELSVIPKINNIRRINMEHYQRAKETEKIIPEKQKEWGSCYKKVDLIKLQNPTWIDELDCRESAVIHFLFEFLPSLEGVIEIRIKKGKGFDLKKSMKKILGRATEPYWSLKRINDEILKLIVFKYRHYNYEFKVSDDLQSLKFIIDLPKK